MATTFVTTLEIQKDPEGGHVYHKQDGQRFNNSVTIKMNVSRAYKFTVTFRPEMRLQQWLVRGESMDFSRVQPKKKEDDVAIYETQWTSVGIDVSKRNTRKEMPIVLEFDRSVTLKTTLQVKFYPAVETEHSKWGQEMHALELSCQIPDGNTYVDIKKEKFY